MTNEKILIIGCGAAGGTAAQFARKTDRKKQIKIFEKGPYPQYSKCGLPYVISRKIKDPSHLIEFTKEWFDKSKINLFLNTEITYIDHKKKIINGKNSEGIFEDTYDSLIIATGANPLIPKIKNLYIGRDLVNGIFSIRTLDDVSKILSILPNIKNPTIIGAGLIGLEMADCLVKRGKHVTIVEALPRILPMLDEDLSKIVEDQIKKYTSLFTNHFAIEVKSKDNAIKNIIIKNRENNDEHTISTDMLIIATGTIPEVSLAKQIGCKIGETGGITVNQDSQTSLSNVYAVGDCTEYRDFITQDPVLVGLGSIAVRQAIAAGINAAGGTYTLPKGVLQTFTSEFFDMEIAAVGPPSSQLKNYEIVTGKHQGLSLPEYFPGGKPILLKNSIDFKTGKILSAQAVGENAAQRINCYATAILGEMTIEMFRKLETAYAPPIAPTLDVITIAADIAHMKQKRKIK